MEINSLLESKEYTEVDIYKLSFKQLKELAVRRNINPKLKKAQLLNALLSEELTSQNNTDLAEIRTRRVTRARASLLKSIDNVLTDPFDAYIDNLQNSSICNNETSLTVTKKEHKAKKRGKRIKLENTEASPNLPIIRIENPLIEIANTDLLSDSKEDADEIPSNITGNINLNQQNNIYDAEVNSNEKDDSKICKFINYSDNIPESADNNQLINFKTGDSKMVINGKTQNNGNSCKSDGNQDIRTSNLDNIKTNTHSLSTSNDIDTSGSRKPSRKRKGKKEKEAEVSKNVNINSCKSGINEDIITTTNVETNTENQSTSSDIDTSESRNPSRKRKGKKEKEADFSNNVNVNICKSDINEDLITTNNVETNTDNRSTSSVIDTSESRKPSRKRKGKKETKLSNDVNNSCKSDINEDLITTNNVETNTDNQSTSSDIDTSESRKPSRKRKGKKEIKLSNDVNNSCKSDINEDLIITNNVGTNTDNQSTSSDIDTSESRKPSRKRKGKKEKEADFSNNVNVNICKIDINEVLITTNNVETNTDNQSTSSDIDTSESRKPSRKRKGKKEKETEPSNNVNVNSCKSDITDDFITTNNVEANTDNQSTRSDIDTNELRKPGKRKGKKETKLSNDANVNSCKSDINKDLIATNNTDKHNTSPDIDTSETEKPSRKRKGKKETEPVTLSYNESHNLNIKEICLPSQENISEDLVSSNQSECSVIESNYIASPSKVAEPINLNSENIKASPTYLQKVSPVTSSSIENMPVAVLTRSSTFVLDNKDSDPKVIHASMIKRSNTFIIYDEDSKNTSFRKEKVLNSSKISIDSKNTSFKGEKVFNSSKKSIGSRIISSSLRIGGMKSAVKHGQGSTIKKTITKNVGKPGSVTKSGAKKAPNFKTIHQKLFGNMESLCDNRTRILERAQTMTQLPVPKCAFPSLKWEPKMKNNNTLNIAGSPKKILTPVRNTLKVGKTKTCESDKKTAPTSYCSNRFGFNKTLLNKEVANTIVGMKLPPVDKQKKKEENRALIQGVRMNKRFMLQMKMRENK